VSPSPGRRLVLGIVSEREFEGWVVRTAERLGWCGIHIRDSEGALMGVHHLRTADHDDAYGFPDWLFCKAGHPPKFRELKTRIGRLSRGQKHWQALLGAAGADVGVWRPDDEDQILLELAA
jgi:hypothetical protein